MTKATTTTTTTTRPLVDRVCTADTPLRVAVMASGGGTNLQALLDAHSPPSPWRVVLVVVNVEGAAAIQRAGAASVKVCVLPHAGRDRAEHEAEIVSALRAADVELVVLAGYMRVLSADVVAQFERRIINVHPALLPSFPGLHGAQQALNHGCRVAGCTVHMVDAGVDTGPILAQAAVPIDDDDDADSLQRRIQREEHRLLPLVVLAYAEGRVVERAGLIRCLDVTRTHG
jgi:phosphoribosylglycinamide formyltransferase-1